MDPTRLSKRTLEALKKLPPTARRRASAIIGRTQTPEYRAKDAADRAMLDREYRQTGRIGTMGEKVDPEDKLHFRRFIQKLRRERLSRRLSMEQLAARSKLDKAALSRLESGKQVNPTVATLMRYARALDLRLGLSLEPPSATPKVKALPPASSSPDRQQ
jgi:ribosome-binding protein aMBF1 (putative translation factor)